LILQNRREIIFLYDVTEANPNGDPDEGNRPRMDDDGKNIVTDVRLKRTIRDYWLNKYNNDTEGKKVLIHREFTSEGHVMTMENLVLRYLDLEEEKNSSKVLNKIITEVPKMFLDVRAFGAAVTVKGANYSHTGTVQFGLGKSLNKPSINTITITTTMASGKEKTAGTFGEYHIVDYSLILFHGIACEYNAKKVEFTEEDLKEIYDGLWNGTKMLNTRTKFNHMPQLLISVVSKENNFQIGDLDRRISLINENIKNIREAEIDISGFISRLDQFKENIEKIEIKEQDGLTYIDNEEKIGKTLKSYLSEKGFNIEEIVF